MYTISQVRKIVDSHFRPHISAHHHRVAAITLSFLLLIFAAFGALAGWLIGYPIEGVITMVALHFLFLALNGDNVDARIEENTNQHLQGINKTILGLPEEKRVIALDDIKRLGDKAKHLLFYSDGVVGVLLRTEE